MSGSGGGQGADLRRGHQAPVEVVGRGRALVAVGSHRGRCPRAGRSRSCDASQPSPVAARDGRLDLVADETGTFGCEGRAARGRRGRRARPPCRRRRHRRSCGRPSSARRSVRLRRRSPHGAISPDGDQAPRVAVIGPPGRAVGLGGLAGSTQVNDEAPAPVGSASRVRSRHASGRRALRRARRAGRRCSRLGRAS